MHIIGLYYSKYVYIIFDIILYHFDATLSPRLPIKSYLILKCTLSTKVLHKENYLITSTTRSLSVRQSLTQQSKKTL